MLSGIEGRDRPFAGLLEHFRSKCKAPKPLPTVAALPAVCELGANSEPRPEEAVYVIAETGLADPGALTAPGAPVWKSALAEQLSSHEFLPRPYLVT